jgi:hypothetical protein
MATSARRIALVCRDRQPRGQRCTSGRRRSEPQCARVPQPTTGGRRDRVSGVPPVDLRSLSCQGHSRASRLSGRRRLALVGVGLQSFDNDVLAEVKRSYDETRFEDNLHGLTEVASVAIEIIMGLPGDNPKTFRATLERARSLPCALRAYHCVVLSSALMVRAPDHYRLDFDPITLKMRSCLGWSEADLQRESENLTQMARAKRGQTGEFFWVFPPRG